MRKIKIERLRPVHPFAKSAGELPDDNVLGEIRHAHDSSHDPENKDRERSQPGPPPAPRGDRVAATSIPPLKRNNPRQQERVNDRPLDQHSRAQEQKKNEAITRLPWFPFSNFLPDQPPDRKQDQGERHVGPHERRQPRCKKIEPESARRHQGCRAAVGRRCRSRDQEEKSNAREKRR